mmetsp:Transcript_20361/g.61837  ORF Transcript_20361/g.61837 Transcript_20361/m.61837 type:complete len:318 (-) Transcript_20361:721-1674(-)
MARGALAREAPREELVRIGVGDGTLGPRPGAAHHIVRRDEWRVVGSLKVSPRSVRSALRDHEVHEGSLAGGVVVHAVPHETALPLEEEVAEGLAVGRERVERVVREAVARAHGSRVHERVGIEHRRVGGVREALLVIRHGELERHVSVDMRCGGFHRKRLLHRCAQLPHGFLEVQFGVLAPRASCLAPRVRYGGEGFVLWRSDLPDRAALREIGLEGIIFGHPVEPRQDLVEVPRVRRELVRRGVIGVRHVNHVDEVLVDEVLGHAGFRKAVLDVRERVLVARCNHHKGLAKSRLRARVQPQIEVVMGIRNARHRNL